MSISMTLTEAAAAMQGELLTNTADGLDQSFVGVSTDSRRGNADALFVALKGERFDAHDFVADVAAQGARAAVVDKDKAAPLQACGLPLIAVDDTRLALGRLACAWRARFSLPLIGVTGSNGKTTAKEMIAAILRAQVVADGADPQTAVLATTGNLNNDIGVPLMLLQLSATHRYAVIEMGMNHPGEIATLAKLADPSVGVVTNALRAHLEGMGSQDGVAQEKGSLYAHLRADGVAVIDADSAFAPLWKTLAGSRRRLTFSMRGTGDIKAKVDAESASSGAPGSTLHLETPGGATSIFLQVVGRHNAHNACVAAAACLAAGVRLPAVTQGLASFAGVKGRLQQKAGREGALVIDDTYNANPDSMRAAIDVLAACASPRILILGDMGETGPQAAAFHREVVDYARACGIDRLLVLGGAMGRAVADAGFGSTFDSHAALADAVLPTLVAKATVLIKGSRFMKMEQVVERLVAPEAATSPSKENLSCS